MIDAHAHVWDLARGDYHWLTPDLPGLFRDFDIGELHGEMAGAGVTRAILVQAAATVAETRWLCALADRADWVVGVVGWLDLAAADPLGAIVHPRLVGVRAMPDAWAGTTLDDPAFDHAFARVAAANLTFDALVEPGDLAAMAQRMRRTPGLRVVIDHGGNPDGDVCWPIDMAALAALGAFAKLSGLVTLPQGADDARLTGVVAQLVALFPDRLLWGSDWPVVTQRCDYGDWTATARRLVASDTDSVFSAAAMAAYQLELR